MKFQNGLKPKDTKINKIDLKSMIDNFGKSITDINTYSGWNNSVDIFISKYSIGVFDHMLRDNSSSNTKTFSYKYSLLAAFCRFMFHSNLYGYSKYLMKIPSFLRTYKIA